MYDRPVASENTPRTLVVATAAWALAVALAATSATFTRLSLTEVATIGAFASLFAIATYYLDRSVRATLDALDLRSLAAAVIAADLAVAAGLAFSVPVALFAAPLAGLAFIVLVDRLIRAASGHKRAGARRAPSVTA